MPKLDGLKEKLTYLRFWLSISVATCLALIGWIATSYEKSSLFLIIASSISVAILIITVLFLNRKMKKIIKEIEEI